MDASRMYPTKQDWQDLPLDPAERESANVDPFEALRDGTEGERYDALAIINEFQIRQALPHLRGLAVRLRLNDSSGAPFELAKVERFIARLATE